jgi:hypothetical protein
MRLCYRVMRLRSDSRVAAMKVAIGVCQTLSARSCGRLRGLLCGAKTHFEEVDQMTAFSVWREPLDHRRSMVASCRVQDQIR